MAPDARCTRSARDDELPLIDVEALRGGDAAGRRELADRFARVSEEMGFLCIVGHGVPRQVVDQAFARARRFFAQPKAAKRAVAVNSWHRGYRGSGRITVQGHRSDLTEVFELGVDLPLDDPDVRAGKPLHGPDTWLPLPGFRAAMEAHFKAVTALGRSLLSSFALALDLPEDFFLDLHDRPLVNLRIIRYPPLPAARPADQYSTATHTDYGMITLLAQDEVGGLQVRLRSGEWIAVPCVAGSFVVNLGDMLACWTNDRFASAPHRVLNEPGTDRYSIPLFYTPRFDAMATCLPTCTGPGNPRRAIRRCAAATTSSASTTARSHPAWDRLWYMAERPEPQHWLADNGAPHGSAVLGCRGDEVSTAVDVGCNSARGIAAML
ncbi:MAG TPA: 2-oxoglutarate and iron-dependent oxygenase domain-containing protein [Mycobacterium sp.]